MDKRLIINRCNFFDRVTEGGNVTYKYDRTACGSPEGIWVSTVIDGDREELIYQDDTIACTIHICSTFIMIYSSVLMTTIPPPVMAALALQEF